MNQNEAGVPSAKKSIHGDRLMVSMADIITESTGVNAYEMLEEITKNGTALRLPPFEYAMVKLAAIKASGIDIKPYVEMFMLGLGSAE